MKVSARWVRREDRSDGRAVLARAQLGGGSITARAWSGSGFTSALESADRPLPLAELRSLCRVRNATLHERLVELTHAGHLVRDTDGYRLAHSNATEMQRS